VLLTGDIEQETERNCYTTRVTSLQLTVLAAHHGSNTSSTSAFIDAVAPQFALVPVGYLNRYRFPKAAVTERYRQARVTVLEPSTGCDLCQILGKGQAAGRKHMAVAASSLLAMGRNRLLFGLCGNSMIGQLSQTDMIEGGDKVLELVKAGGWVMLPIILSSVIALEDHCGTIVVTAGAQGITQTPVAGQVWRWEKFTSSTKHMKELQASSPLGATLLPASSIVTSIAM
jgi:hypothetical protein